MIQHRSSRLRSRILRTAAITVGLSALLGVSACSTSGAPTSGGAAHLGSSLEEIKTLAKQEGKVQLIAYPKDWANYAESFEIFTKNSGVKVDVANPDGSSAEELEAVRNLKGQVTQPDVLDIGSTFTRPAMDDQLVQPYKPTTFDEIPAALKDPDGNWTAAYYGVMSIGVNAKSVPVPKTWKDLLKPEYKGKIAMGDPRDGASVLASVFAASLANGGSIDDIGPGIDFFAKLADQGQLVSTKSGSQALATGEAAVMLDWNFNFPGIEEEMAKSGVDLKTTVPTDGVFGTYYAQPLTADTARPNAGALWIEHLLSDEGAVSYAKSGAIPARYEALVAKNAIPADVLQKLPAADIVKKITFPNPVQSKAATDKVTADWAAQVAAKLGR